MLYSCSCHVLLAEFRTLANLTGFHVFALMHVFAQIFFFRTGGDASSQKIERSVSIFFLIALSYIPVAAMCFLLKHLCRICNLMLSITRCFIIRGVPSLFFFCKPWRGIIQNIGNMGATHIDGGGGGGGFWTTPNFGPVPRIARYGAIFKGWSRTPPHQCV